MSSVEVRAQLAEDMEGEVPEEASSASPRATTGARLTSLGALSKTTQHDE